MWSGAISFGLVNIPVQAFTAVREHTVHFNQLDKGSGSRIRYDKVSEKSGKKVDSDEIELGYQVNEGRYVVVQPEELADLRPRSTRTIEVSDFVDLAAIDPIYYNRTYWLAPNGDAAVRAYRLLLAAMEEQQRVGLGSVVIRTKQYLAAIRPLEGVLAMSTMHFADEVVAASSIDQLPSGKAKVDPKERRLAAQIIDSLATDWDPKRYHDTYTEELRRLIEQRAKGEEVVVEEAPAARAQMTDLLEALQASLDSAKKAKNGRVTKELEAAADRLSREQDGDSDSSDSDLDSDSSQRRSPKRGSSSRRPAKKAPATSHRK